MVFQDLRVQQAGYLQSTVTGHFVENCSLGSAPSYPAQSAKIATPGQENF